MKKQKIFAAFVAVMMLLCLLSVFGFADEVTDISSETATVAAEDIAAPEAQAEETPVLYAAEKEEAAIEENAGEEAAAVETIGATEEAETEEAEEEAPASKFANSFWALLPPIVAIALALITKEVYSSLFVGILVGGLLYSNFSFRGTMEHVFVDGFIGSVADAYNVGILMFLAILGTMVAIINKSGGSAAFGRFAKKHIKTRVGAQIMTIIFGCLIFIDDYFNCLTVGSVMRPVTDTHKVSRAKLAYLIDATAAPVCIIAPISSWAAAVAGFVSESEVSGFKLFINAIPYNFYAIFTIIMMFTLVGLKFDYGPMKLHERNAIEKGDLFTSGGENYVALEEEEANPKGRVLDLVLPVAVLILSCIVGMIYSGGFFDKGEEAYHSFIVAFSNSDASVGLVLGSFVTLIFTVLYVTFRKVSSFKGAMECLPEGFKAMGPAIMILICAWTLKAMTDSLGAKEYIAGIVESSANNFSMFLPAIIFLIAVGLSFATGTSWGTFGILIPLVLAVFPYDKGVISIISISACMAGAVCGDHCSPISDTTIMASAGSQSNHINHVSTQIPYAFTVAGISFVTYIIAGVLAETTGSAWISIPAGLALTIGTLLVIKLLSKTTSATPAPAEAPAAAEEAKSEETEE